jgi:transcriptional regulator with XRE-family HTH domain
MSDSGLPIVARRLREARVRLGLSQKALGIAASIKEDSASPRMNQYEQGKHAPDFLTLTNLASALAVPVPYFYAEDEQLAKLLLLLHDLPRSELETVKKYLARKVAKSKNPIPPK